MQAGQVWSKGISNQAPDQEEKAPAKDQSAPDGNEQPPPSPTATEEQTAPGDDQALPENLDANPPAANFLPPERTDKQWPFPLGEEEAGAHRTSGGSDWALAVGALALGGLAPRCLEVRESWIAEGSRSAARPA